MKKLSQAIIPGLLVLAGVVSLLLISRTRDPGQVVYQNRCAGCHGDNGEGIARLVPPLAGADFLMDNPGLVPCIIRNGMQGEIVVNGDTFDSPMPAIENLTDVEVLNVTNYILNSWGNRGGYITLEQMKTQLRDCNTEHH